MKGGKMTSTTITITHDNQNIETSIIGDVPLPTMIGELVIIISKFIDDSRDQMEGGDEYKLTNQIVQ